jgi:hypothetical protein
VRVRVLEADEMVLIVDRRCFYRDLYTQLDMLWMSFQDFSGGQVQRNL